MENKFITCRKYSWARDLWRIETTQPLQNWQTWQHVEHLNNIAQFLTA